MIAGIILAMLIGASSADADSAYQARQFDRAAALYSELVKAEPENARAWYRLGVSDAALGKSAEARAALQRSLSLGYDAMSVHYRLASVAASNAQPAETVSELQAAIAARPFGPETYADDPAFARVAKTPEFVALLDEQNHRFHPCRYDAVYRALDFWVGDWNVSGQGGSAGTSHVESALDGCALLETWNGNYGDNGRSISGYDPARKRWVQHYVSGRARVTEYEGSVVDGSVDLISKSGLAWQRMTFTKLPDGKVRQRFAQSKDGGKTWSAPNDLIYEKR
jgi:tetratricopeptide (TPR) repeat protein